MPMPPYPVEVSEWDPSGNKSIAPSPGYRETGFEPGAPIPSGIFNWILNNAFGWISALAYIAPKSDLYFSAQSVNWAGSGVTADKVGLVKVSEGGAKGEGFSAPMPRGGDILKIEVEVEDVVLTTGSPDIQLSILDDTGTAVAIYSEKVSTSPGWLELLLTSGSAEEIPAPWTGKFIVEAGDTAGDFTEIKDIKIEFVGS